MLQIDTALFYYKLRQTLCNMGMLFHIRARVITKRILKNRAAITNWDKMYYKLGEVLQIRAFITNWDITVALLLILLTLTSMEHFINLFKFEILKLENLL